MQNTAKKRLHISSDLTPNKNEIVRSALIFNLGHQERDLRTVSNFWSISRGSPDRLSYYMSCMSWVRYNHTRYRLFHTFIISNHSSGVRYTPAMLSAVALVLAAVVGHGLAVLVNRTIDDQLGDPIGGIMPTYFPPGNWTQGATCSQCYAQPDRSKVFDGTWHDSTYFVESQIPRTITMTFNGALGPFHGVVIPYT